MKSARIALVILLAGATAGFAEGTYDADGDGMVTLEEIQVSMPDFTAELFAQADTNADGMLDAAELAAAADAGLLPAAE